MSEQFDWKRLDEGRLRNTGSDDNPNRLSFRIFGDGGKLWPRMLVSIWNNRLRGGVTIGASFKRGPGEWWHECGIPPELLSEIPEMLEEANARLEQIQQPEPYGKG